MQCRGRRTREDKFAESEAVFSQLVDFLTQLHLKFQGAIIDPNVQDETAGRVSDIDTVMMPKAFWTIRYKLTGR